ncbi:MAG: tetratricopeptide repeat protein [Alphaproteobacteria bacterium]|nr:tetratricopeptide repeat protein [Alphaproteobacteria bacterium]
MKHIILTPPFILAITIALTASPPLARAANTGEHINAAEYLPAVHALNNARYDIASAHLEQVSQSDPDNNTILNQHLSLALRTQRLDVARDAAAEVVARRDENEDNLSVTLAHLVLAAFAVKDKEYKDALELLARVDGQSNAALSPFGYTPVVGLLKAVSLAALDNEPAALRAIRVIGETEGWEDAGLIFEVLVLHHLGRADEAVDIGLQAVEDEILDVPQAVLLIGAILQESGRADEAEALYADSLTRSMGEYRVRDRLFELRAGNAPAPLSSTPADAAARFLTELSRIEASIPTLRNAALDSISLALILSDTDADTLYVSGSLWETLRDYESALAAYALVPADGALGWKAMLQRAQIHIYQDDYDAALALLEDLPDRWEHHDRAFLLGNLHRYREEWNESAAAYGEALERYPREGRGLWRLHYLRGIAYERGDMWPRAEQDFLSALELEPDEANVLNYLAYTWTEQDRNLDEALEMLERAIAFEPESGHIIDSLGWVYYKLGSFDLATRYLEAAASYLPDDPVVNDHLGDAYWRGGRLREARVQWRRALGGGDHPEGEEYLREKLENGLDGAF